MTKRKLHTVTVDADCGLSAQIMYILSKYIKAYTSKNYVAEVLDNVEGEITLQTDYPRERTIEAMAAIGYGIHAMQTYGVLETR